jgi:hypothetical protein
MTLISICATNIAVAQPSDRFPVSVETNINGERYQAFDLGGFTELLAIDEDLSYYSRLVRIYVNTIDTLRLESFSLRERVRSLLTQRDLLATDRTRLRSLWSSENRRRHRAETRVSFSSWFGWGLAAILAATTITLGFVVATK